MFESKTHYEQVPLDVVLKLADGQLRREKSEQMRELSKEYWMQLCEQASIEQDPQRLLVLVTEINELLEKKHGRLAKTNSL